MSTVDVLGDIEKSEEFDVYDYSNAVAIIEIKGRHNDKRFPDALIEEGKYLRLLDECGEKHCLYVMNSGRNIYVFDIKKLTEEGYDFGFKDRGGMPKTTFWSNQMITKSCGYINWDKAMRILKWDTENKEYRLR